MPLFTMAIIYGLQFLDATVFLVDSGLIWDPLGPTFELNRNEGNATL